MSSTVLNQQLNIENKENESEPLKNTQNSYQNEFNPKKRKSTSEIQKPIQNNILKNNPKSSKSLSEMVLSNKTQNEVNANGEKRKSESSETIKALGDGQKSSKSTKTANEEDAGETKPGVQHSTPTSTFDDGYESCNSTPHGSGKSFSFSS